MDQTFHSSQVNEHTKVSDIGDRAFYTIADLKTMKQFRPSAGFSKCSAFREDYPPIFRNALDHLYVQCATHIRFETGIAISFLFLTRKVDQMREWDKARNGVSLHKQTAAVMSSYCHGNNPVIGIQLLDLIPICLDNFASWMSLRSYMQCSKIWPCSHSLLRPYRCMPSFFCQHRLPPALISGRHCVFVLSFCVAIANSHISLL